MFGGKKSQVAKICWRTSSKQEVLITLWGPEWRWADVKLFKGATLVLLLLIKGHIQRGSIIWFVHTWRRHLFWGGGREGGSFSFRRSKGYRETKRVKTTTPELTERPWASIQSEAETSLKRQYPFSLSQRSWFVKALWRAHDPVKTLPATMLTVYMLVN